MVHSFLEPRSFEQLRTMTVALGTLSKRIFWNTGLRQVKVFLLSPSSPVCLFAGSSRNWKMRTLHESLSLKWTYSRPHCVGPNQLPFGCKTLCVWTSVLDWDHQAEFLGSIVSLQLTLRCATCDKRFGGNIESTGEFCKIPFQCTKIPRILSLSQAKSNVKHNSPMNADFIQV